MRQTKPDDPPAPQKKPARFIGSALKDLRALPEEVQDVFGRAILRAQWGGKAVNAKPLKGYKGAGVLEIVADYATDTYRAVYTVRFESAVYVLHAFQKKSKRGIQTDTRDLELIEARLKVVEAVHATWLATQAQLDASLTGEDKQDE